ncbi:UNVERIFIED_ORG: glycerate kinase [Arthrobacter sp. UYCu721]
MPEHSGPFCSLPVTIQDYERPFHVALAFDSFKGSLTAERACFVAGHAISAAFGEKVRLTHHPMADGGEGSLDLLLASGDFTKLDVETTDAIGRPIAASWLISADGRNAHIEVARACGLPGLSGTRLRPTHATSEGVGKIILVALDAGVNEVTLYLGGSASTDGGAGMLSVLGAQFLDEAGNRLPPGGGALNHLVRADFSHLREDARSVKWTIVTDVDVPLTGPRGAARMFAPQKGATAPQVVELEDALENLASVCSQSLGMAVGTEPGSGAAGGLGCIPLAAFDARAISGAELFAETSGLKETLIEADLVITGEGRFDDQSSAGKVVGAVSQLARSMPHPVAVVVLAGGVEMVTVGEPLPAFSLARGPATLLDLTTHSESLLSRLAEAVVRLALAVRGSVT